MYWYDILKILILKDGVCFNDLCPKLLQTNSMTPTSEFTAGLNLHSTFNAIKP